MKNSFLGLFSIFLIVALKTTEIYPRKQSIFITNSEKKMFSTTENRFRNSDQTRPLFSFLFSSIFLPNKQCVWIFGVDNHSKMLQFEVQMSARLRRMRKEKLDGYWSWSLQGLQQLLLTSFFHIWVCKLVLDPSYNNFHCWKQFWS